MTEPRPLKPHLSFVSGLLMGAADAVPGVSGGTIALVIGIYERFLGALATMIKAPWLVRTPEGRAQLGAALGLLVPLGAGLLIAYYLGTKLLVGPKGSPGILLRPETAPYCYAFFSGLVLVSVVDVWNRKRHHPAVGWLLALVGFAVAWVFTGLPYAAAAPPMWALVLNGAVAIGVMLLPGISGSMYLVIVGHYLVVAGAVHDMNIPVILLFVLGIALGVITFVPGLRYLLRRHPELTLSALTGLMAGSLRALWPWKTGYDPKAGQMQNTGVGDGLALVVVMVLVGGAVVWLLSRLEQRILAESAREDAAANAG